MRERTILHCDLNNFFASVSLLSCPTLYDSPVAVCGSVEDRHGIVLAKNEIAKKSGVKTAEAIWEAKIKCPELIILKPEYDKYIDYSIRAKSIYARYTDLIEPFGIDECWLDITGSTLLFGDGETVANKIRKDIKRELGITISVGVSFNKIFAKLGSDMKKPDAVTVISKDNFKEKVWPLPVEDLLFVGTNTKNILNRVGIFTIGDLTLCDTKSLKNLIGISGEHLRNYALGLDNSPVVPESDDYKPKSVGRSVTPKADLYTKEEVWKVYVKLGEDIAKTLKSKNLFATGICVHTRDTSLKTKEVSRSFSIGTNCSMTLAKKAFELFCQVYTFEKPLRSVGFRAINLKDTAVLQWDIFGETKKEEKNEIIDNSMLELRKKFGKESIKRAISI